MAYGHEAGVDERQSGPGTDGCGAALEQNKENAPEVYEKVSVAIFETPDT